MKQIVIKKLIDGEFREVKRYSEEEVVSIRHHTDGLEVILKGNIRLYDTQCIIEFEEECYDNIGKHLLNWFKDCKWDAVDNGTLKRDDIIAWLEKRIEKSSWSEEDENGFCDSLWAIQKARTIAKDENEMGNLWYAERWLNSIKKRMKGE